MNTPNVFIHGEVFGQCSQAHGIDLGMSCAGLEVRLNEPCRSLLTFYDPVSVKKVGLRTISLPHGCGGCIMTKDEEKAEVLGAIFASVFNSKAGCSLGTQSHEIEDWDGDQKEACILGGP